MIDSKKTNKPFKKRYWESMSTIWAGAGEKRKRGLRILPKGQGYFVHVTSRTVGQAFFFGDQEKRVFVEMMRKWADFSGLGILTYCLMDNHFHIMLWVPERVKLNHLSVLQRLEMVWPEEKVQAWDVFYQKQDASTKAAMDNAILDRMANLSEFMRVLKQSFTCWYNRNEDRKGTLWDSRYRSVVVENSPLALMSVAAYIDLNPLRAGIENDPGSYIWSGYGAAVNMDAKSRAGLKELVCLSRGHQPNAMKNVRVKQFAGKLSSWNEIAPAMAVEHEKRSSPENWQEVQAAYRIWLVNKAESKQSLTKGSRKNKVRRGLDPLQVIAEYERQGKVSFSKGFHSKIRSFSRGVALGSPDFLEKLMSDYRSCFGENREKAGRRVKGMGPCILSMRQAD